MDRSKTPVIDLIDSNLGGDAGTLSIVASNGTTSLDGVFNVASVAGYKGAQVSMNLKSGDAGSLLGAVQGFSGKQALTLATGDVTVGNITAQDVELSASTGTLTVTGTINASLANGGTIRLTAGDRAGDKPVLELGGSAVLETGSGGSVFLGIDSSGSTFQGTDGGRIKLDSGGAIIAPGGQVWLRAPRIGNTGIAIHDDGVTIVGAREIDAEAVAVTDISSNPYVDQNIAAANTAAQAYMANAATIEASIGAVATNSVFHLMPGIEFDSTGNMQLLQTPSSLNTGIDLHNYRYNGEPMVLTLRAAGNFTMNGSLSDGFGSPVSSPDGNIFAIASLLSAGTRSATLRLVAGANLAGADPDALIAKDLLAAGTGAINFNDPHNDASGYPIPSVLRTGTGDLDIAAAGSVALLTPFGIYTAGTQSGAVSGFTAPTRLMVKSARSGAVNSYLGFQSYNKSTKTGVSYDSLYPALAFYPSYPEGGGDLTVTVQGSLTSASVKGRTGALYAGSESDTFWLWTEGQQSGQRINNGTAFINFGTYYQTFNGGGFSGTDVAPSVAAFRGLGALGGGNASISVGGDMANVDVAVPVTLRAPAGATSWQSVAVTGGGNLQLNIAGALNNANIIVGGGVGTVHAADIGSNASVTLTPEGDAQLSAIADRSMTVLLGDATRSVAQGGGIPFGLDGCEGAVIGACSSKLPYGFFSSYTQNTAFDVLAMGGNITLNGDFVPPIMDVVAATGSITSTQALTSSNGPATGMVGYGSILIALPASTAQLNLLAGQDIKSTGISMTGMMPVPIPATFQSDYAATIFNFQNQMGSTVASDLIQPNDPHTVHVYALGSLKNIFLATPKRTDVRAGLDILSPVFELQNYLTTDVSLVEAGRDIYSGTPTADAFNIRLGGPGTLDVVAGRNITIQTPPQQSGNSPQGMGISSIGNADNPLLPKTGASLNIMAGVGPNGPDIAAFISAYFDPANAAGVLQNYTPDLVEYMQQLEGNSALTAAQALADFRALAPNSQLPLVAQVYFDELRAGGEAAANGQGAGGKGYDRAYKAIETLFPGSNIGTPTTGYPGDLSVYQLGRIRTEAGGDINILVPGGNITLGVENQTPNLSGQTDTARPGVLTLRDGNINTFSDGSVIVAQSRVFTELGGNILMFSTNGDLNAGKGKKTTLVTSPPQFTVDPYGNVTKAPVTPQTGAGIATLIGVPGVPPGNVDLFAPHGTIDAGDAGIRVSGNVTLQALQILNANNIQVQGTAVGIPTVQGPPVGALTTANNTAGATQTVTPQKADNGDRPSIVIVEFIGFGGADGSAPEDTNQHDRREKHSLNEPHYDPNSMFQIVGSGELNDEQKKLLTGESGETSR